MNPSRQNNVLVELFIQLRGQVGPPQPRRVNRLDCYQRMSARSNPDTGVLLELLRYPATLAGTREASILLPIAMVVLDGASDRLGPERTPLEEASTPNLDALAQRGAMGLMYTVGKGIAPESDAGVFSQIGRAHV